MGALGRQGVVFVKHTSLVMRVIASTLLLVSVLCCVFGAFTWYFFSIRTNDEAKQEAGRELAYVLGRIAAIDHSRVPKSKPA